MHDKKRVILIISVIVLCVIGIGLYIKDFNTKDSKKHITTKVENKVINITDKTKAVKISPDKIKNVEEYENVCDILDSNNLIIEGSEKIFLKYAKDKKQQFIKEMPKDSCIVSVKTYKNYIVFIEHDMEKKNEDDEPFEINTVYVYDIDSKSLTKVKGGSLAKKSDGTYYTKEYVVGFMQLHDGNLFYCLYNQIDDNTCDSIVFMYNIDNKQEKQIYTLKPTKDNSEGIISFDVDIDKGYLVCQDSDNSDERLELINLKKNIKQTLAKTQSMFVMVLDYPNIAFLFNNDIHVYNIEKNDDDLCIKCDETPMMGIAFKDKKVIFSTKKIYCYSMKEKKLYDIDSAESEVRSNDKYVFYNNKGRLSYIKIDDIN